MRAGRTVEAVRTARPPNPGENSSPVFCLMAPSPHRSEPPENPGRFKILARLAEIGAPVPLILDQSRVSDRHQVLMLSVRWGKRALPVAWRVEMIDGAVGFAVQQNLLDAVRG